MNRNARFEVVADGLRRLRTLPAYELKPGDHVIVLDETSRALYSDLLLETLDSGPLRVEADQRNNWLTLVRTVQAASGMSVLAISRKMKEAGHPADPQTIRTWLRADNSAAAVPDSRVKFAAFARALNINLDESDLGTMYEGIDVLRRSHRVIGRELAKAIRATRAGRLGAASRQRIERTWGLGVRELVESARIAVIEEVLKPPEEMEVHAVV